ncbi:reverse transcriptase domain-containing protein [Tanacetum coccineum]|uniref:Reverse transcriptase domain-containing protein n=1 Tax=Tanacetum coccineum TaxID=301880 RepID=A0ABQ4YYX1_9ASTR
MYVDGGASSEILYEHCFNQLRPEIRKQMVLAATYVVGFSGEIICPLGQVSLLVKIGDEEHSTSAWMNFMVVRSHSPYNGIIGRPGVRKIKAIPSTAHGMLKFPVTGEMVTLRSSRIIPLECAMISGPRTQQPVVDQDAEEKIQVAIHPEYPEKTIAIGSTLTKEGRKKLCKLLKKNLDIFAWQPADMTGVLRHIAEHRLNVREGCFPVRQKKRGQASERNKAICEEVEKLVNAGIMKEVHYHSWLSNPIIVKKHDNSWRMCVDFKDLNKACPKDGYPLPEIDWKVESLCGYPFKCFLDAYKGYHQIKMAKEDEEKTAFITSQGIFCYSKMPFGLKNAGATYQRLVDKAFQKQIGQNLEAYVDDLVIKSCTEQEVIRDVEETFRTLRKINMKLNPKKCTFGMKEGVFLGYKVNSDGLMVCPDKVEAVLSLPSPKCLKDVQRLNGKLASLNRFLSKSAERSLPFFKTLKKCTKKSDFQWTTEAETAFQQMKKSIAELPMMAAPQEKEELIIYLAAAKEAISAVLMTERDGKQIPIYFVSRVLQGLEINYTPMEKLVLAIYQPRTSVKGKILVDFIVERLEDNSEDTLMEDAEELPDPWILFTDGSSCTDSSGAGLILTNLEGMEFTYALRFRFNATNNEAEYEALIAGLKIVEQMGVENLQANVDSRLVANQVPINENKKADALSKIASISFAHLSKQVLVEELKEKSISAEEVFAIVEKEGDTWMTPIFKYLTDRTLPAERKKERAVKRPGKVKFLIVAIDYFTKWIEAKQVATITGSQIKKFVWDNIVCRFRLPGEIISDNGKQFQDNPFKDCNRDTPFSLTYEMEVVIPAEIGMPTLTTSEVSLEENKEALEINLDLLEERREQAAIREAKSKAKMERYYNSKV